MLLFFLNVTPINQDKNMKLLGKHFNSPFHLFDFTSLLSKYMTSFSDYVPLVNEYFANFCHTLLLSIIVYFLIATLDYIILYIWQKDNVMPKFEGQFLIGHEILWSCVNLLGQAVLTSFLFMAIPRYSYIYYEFSDYSMSYFCLSVVLHIMFDEFWTYWAHRWLHTYQFLYKNLHESHHLSVDTTPFAALAFHPFDALMQGIPTMASCFFFPIHYDFYLVYLFMTTIWAVFIHDNTPVLPIKIFLYCTHHTIHHEPGIGKLKNYGKFTSVMDRLLGTYEDPDRIDYGWKRNETFMSFCRWVNYYVNTFIPNNAWKKLMRKIKGE